MVFKCLFGDFNTHFLILFRLKTVQMEKIKFRIVREVENSDAEEKCIAEYRRELELLMQEKMSHVEELRQIHADINAVSFFLLFSIFLKFIFNWIFNFRWKLSLSKLKRIVHVPLEWQIASTKNIYL